MKDNVRSLAIPGVSTLEEILTKMLDNLSEDEKTTKINSAVFIMESAEGFGYYNLLNNKILTMIGLLEVAKDGFITEIYQGDEDV